MRKLAIAVALASTAISTPVVARDHSPYIGVDVGPMIVEHFQSDFRSPDLDVNNGVDFRHKVGFDVDVNAGYDFGPFRAEAELAYKRAGVREIGFREQLQNEQLGGYFNADGKVTTISGMINGLVDFGGDDGWSGFVGGGVGLASTKYSTDVTDPAFGTPGSPLPEPPLTAFSVHDSDSAWAWQLIAGVKIPLSENLDLGLKYRMFNTTKVRFGGDTDIPYTVSGRMRSHSLLVGLAYNFYTPPPPPPPPPATQTCPDGSVILATDTCPAPPPPPPPPPPAPERGF